MRRYTTRCPETRTRNQEVVQNQPRAALPSAGTFRRPGITAHLPPGPTSSLWHLRALQKRDEGRPLILSRYMRHGPHAAMAYIGHTPVPREAHNLFLYTRIPGTWRLPSACISSYQHTSRTSERTGTPTKLGTAAHSLFTAPPAPAPFWILIWHRTEMPHIRFAAQRL